MLHENFSNIPPAEELKLDHAALTDGHARATGEHSCRNVHSLELLEEKLGGIGDVDLSNLGLVLARAALERLLRKVATSCQLGEWGLVCCQLTQ